jgi:hypothetical protein
VFVVGWFTNTRSTRPFDPEESVVVAIALPAPSRGFGPRRAMSPRVRRRRCQLATVAMLGLLVTLVWALWGVVGWLGSGPLAAPESVPTRLAPAAAVTYVVQPGDTLRTIARATHPKGDIRPVVDGLAAQTHRHPLQVGDHILLP